MPGSNAVRMWAVLAMVCVFAATTQALSHQLNASAATVTRHPVYMDMMLHEHLTIASESARATLVFTTQEPATGNVLLCRTAATTDTFPATVNYFESTVGVARDFLSGAATARYDVSVGCYVNANVSAAVPGDCMRSPTEAGATGCLLMGQEMLSDVDPTSPVYQYARGILPIRHALADTTANIIALTQQLHHLGLLYADLAGRDDEDESRAAVNLELQSVVDLIARQHRSRLSTLMELYQFNFYASSCRAHPSILQIHAWLTSSLQDTPLHIPVEALLNNLAAVLFDHNGIDCVLSSVAYTASLLNFATGVTNGTTGDIKVGSDFHLNLLRSVEAENLSGLRALLEGDLLFLTSCQQSLLRQLAAKVLAIPGQVSSNATSKLLMNASREACDLELRPAVPSGDNRTILALNFSVLPVVPVGVGQQIELSVLNAKGQWNGLFSDNGNMALDLLAPVEATLDEDALASMPTPTAAPAHQPHSFNKGSLPSCGPGYADEVIQGLYTNCTECVNNIASPVFCPGDGFIHLCFNRPLSNAAYAPAGASWSSPACPFQCLLRTHLRNGSACVRPNRGHYPAPDGVGEQPCSAPSGSPSDYFFTGSGAFGDADSCPFLLRRRITSTNGPIDVRTAQHLSLCTSPTHVVSMRIRLSMERVRNMTRDLGEFAVQLAAVRRTWALLLVVREAPSPDSVLIQFAVNTTSGMVHFSDNTTWPVDMVDKWSAVDVMIENAQLRVSFFLDGRPLGLPQYLAGIHSDSCLQSPDGGTTNGNGGEEPWFAAGGFVSNYSHRVAHVDGARWNAVPTNFVFLPGQLDDVRITTEPLLPAYFLPPLVDNNPPNSSTAATVSPFGVASAVAGLTNKGLLGCPWGLYGDPSDCGLCPVGSIANNAASCTCLPSFLRVGGVCLRGLPGFGRPLISAPPDPIDAEEAVTLVHHDVPTAGPTARLDIQCSCEHPYASCGVSPVQASVYGVDGIAAEVRFIDAADIPGGTRCTISAVANEVGRFAGDDSTKGFMVWGSAAALSGVQVFPPPNLPLGPPAADSPNVTVSSYTLREVFARMPVTHDLVSTVAGRELLQAALNAATVRYEVGNGTVTQSSLSLFDTPLPAVGHLEASLVVFCEGFFLPSRPIGIQYPLATTAPVPPSSTTALPWFTTSPNNGTSPLPTPTPGNRVELPATKYEDVDKAAEVLGHPASMTAASVFAVSSLALLAYRFWKRLRNARANKVSDGAPKATIPEQSGNRFEDDERPVRLDSVVGPGAGCNPGDTVPVACTSSATPGEVPLSFPSPVFDKSPFKEAVQWPGASPGGMDGNQLLPVSPIHPALCGSPGFGETPCG